VEHRARLTEALAASIEEKGYRATTVADVVRLARTSRRTFYEHFADRDACFLALFDETTDRVMEQLAAAVEPADPPERPCT
jgi:AcrR family transcriptional regulator